MYTLDDRDGKTLLHNVPPPSSFDPSKQTIFLVHGFLQGTSGHSIFGWVDRAKDAFLDNQLDYNIITTNWHDGALVGTFDLDYPNASQNTRVVGDVMGALMNWLAESTDMPHEKIYCAGHSLGAHVCGSSHCFKNMA